MANNPVIDESLLSLYENSDHLQRLKGIVLKAMEFNSIESAIFTLLHNWREHIITKKKMKEYYTSNETIIYDRGLTQCSSWLLIATRKTYYLMALFHK